MTGQARDEEEEEKKIILIFGMIRANCNTPTNVGMEHFYRYQLNCVSFASRQSKMGAIFQDGHEQINSNQFP